MQVNDIIEFNKARPWISGCIALFIYLRWGRQTPGTPEDRMKNCFKEADTFLNTFEDHNKIK